jgi:Putative beta-barrel porin-2, OmpL-like. bbp2
MSRPSRIIPHLLASHCRRPLIDGFVTWKSRDELTNLTLIGAWVPDQLPRFAPADAPYVPTATTPPTPALAGRVNPFYASSYRNFYSLVVTHQWSEKLTEVVETDHVYDPKIIGFSTNGKPSSIYYAGLVHWVIYNFTDKLSGGWRSEVFWDPYGAATGSRSTFYEMSLVLTAKPKPWLWIRPEARYDWSQFTHPFSNGTCSSQLTLAISTILLF